MLLKGPRGEQLLLEGLRGDAERPAVAAAPRVKKRARGERGSSAKDKLEGGTKYCNFCRLYKERREYEDQEWSKAKNCSRRVCIECYRPRYRQCRETLVRRGPHPEDDADGEQEQLLCPGCRQKRQCSVCAKAVEKRRSSKKEWGREDVERSMCNSCTIACAVCGESAPKVHFSKAQLRRGKA